MVNKESLELKENFEEVLEGVAYSISNFTVTPKGLKEKNGPKTFIQFVRGSMKDSDGIDAKDGVVHEGLLAMMIHDLEYKNDKVPCQETEEAIKKLKEALGWLRERQIDRQRRSVQGTYEQ